MRENNFNKSSWTWRCCSVAGDLLTCSTAHFLSFYLTQCCIGPLLMLHLHLLAWYGRYWPKNGTNCTCSMKGFMGVRAAAHLARISDCWERVLGRRSCYISAKLLLQYSKKLKALRIKTSVSFLTFFFLSVMPTVQQAETCRKGIFFQCLHPPPLFYTNTACYK